MTGRVLIVAGSDSSGGAGIQADIKTVTALGGYAATAIAALTAQNTRGVFGVLDVPESFIRQQIELVLEDIGVDAIKTGMLSRPSVIEMLADVIAEQAADVPLVVDPVMVAKGGSKLLGDDALEAMRTRLIPLARVITPNIPEAEVLTGRTIKGVSDMIEAGRQLLALGPQAVVVKGGHLEGDSLTDALITEGCVDLFQGQRIDTPHTHGTGCTMASAIATGLAQGLSLSDSLARAREYVRIAIATAPGLGHGHGPLNHGHTVAPFPVQTNRGPSA